VSRFDLGDLVHLIDSWSLEMVQAYNPVTDIRAATYLSTHLAGAPREADRPGRGERLGR
jgi:hypothetical protein